MTDAPLHEYADMLSEIVGVYEVLVDPRVTPAPSSLAASELQQAASERSGEQGAWSEETVREAYQLAIMNYHAALERAKAIALLMTGVVTAIPLSDLVRPLVESASQAWWLLEPDIGHMRRVRRMQALRYRSAVEGERTAEADGLLPGEYSQYTETKEQVERDSQTWGLELPTIDRKRRDVYVCGEERLPTPRFRVEQLFSKIDLPSIYPLFSGYSHGETYALWREFELSTDGALGNFYRPILNEDSFKGIAAVAIYALNPPAERLSRLYGLGDQGESSE